MAVLVISHLLENHSPQSLGDILLLMLFSFLFITSDI